MQDLGHIQVRTLLANTPLAIAAVDEQGDLSMVSPALQAMLARPFEPVNELEIASYFRLHDAGGKTPLRPEEVPLVRARRGEVVVDALLSSLREDGTVVHVRTNAAPFRDQHDEIVGAVVFIQDISAEWAAQHEQDELRSRLVDTVNHEFRTPLAKLLGHVELLEGVRDNLPAQARDSVDAVARATYDLCRLVGTVTELTDLGGRPGSPTPLVTWPNR